MTIHVKAMGRMGLVSVVALCLGLGLASNASAQNSSSDLHSRLTHIWSRIVRDDEDRERSLVSRGPLCVLSPTHLGADTPEIWRDQPVIVWQPGAVAKVSLAVDSKIPFWEYTPSADKTHVIYDGEPLEPGETYTLGLYAIENADPTLIPNFQIVSAETRTLISNELESSSSPNESTVSDAEWAAIQQAEYFVEHNFPYDAIQSLFSVSEPSAELLGIQEKMIENVCTPSQD
ncbi:hypothetical protein Lepto7375DRAFT_0269 [Leptolyngbya sp. PCC 7375]|nr:hypothetical protein Lepto7375DRAFT_0269 [Leptolyngbya sp. PCC 7375]